MEIMQSNKAKQSVCLSHTSLEVCQGDVEDGELSLLDIVPVLQALHIEVGLLVGL